MAAEVATTAIAEALVTLVGDVPPAVVAVVLFVAVAVVVVGLAFVAARPEEP